MGLEPTTSGTTIRRSNQLSYTHRTRTFRIPSRARLALHLLVRSGAAAPFRAHRQVYSTCVQPVKGRLEQPAHAAPCEVGGDAVEEVRGQFISLPTYRNLEGSAF